jgi:hypothetical protein
MGKPKDQRGRLAEEPFAFQASAGGKVFISWQGSQVMILRGDDAQAFLKRVAGQDARTQQLVMAKATGNFKRGNER